MSASSSSTELLRIRRVQERTVTGKSNIYRLMALGRFPHPIQFGGSKWVASEVEEFIQRRIEARDRQHGQNDFAPRPNILSGQGGAQNESFDNKPETSTSQLPSTVRTLSPELCEALRMLRLDIPELYLDYEAWNVSLAIIKVELPPVQPTKKHPKVRRSGRIRGLTSRISISDLRSRREFNLSQS